MQLLKNFTMLFDDCDVETGDGVTGRATTN